MSRSVRRFRPAAEPLDARAVPSLSGAVLPMPLLPPPPPLVYSPPSAIREWLDAVPVVFPGGPDDADPVPVPVMPPPPVVIPGIMR